jgi:hypothetical protein
LLLQRMHGTPTRGKLPVHPSQSLSSSHNCVENYCVLEILMIREHIEQEGMRFDRNDHAVQPGRGPGEVTWFSAS